MQLTSENESTNGCPSPLDLYDEKVKTGELKRDAYQMTVVEELQQLHTKLKSYKPIPYVEATGFFSKVIHKNTLRIKLKAFYLIVRDISATQANNFIFALIINY